VVKARKLRDHDIKTAFFVNRDAKRLSPLDTGRLRNSIEVRIKRALRNAGVEIVPNTDNVSEIYKQAKVVLMPSKYESFGMVAAECMLQGIPVIASDTGGLKECLGDYPTYKLDLDLWEKVLKELLNDETIYKKMRNFATVRGKKIKQIQLTHIDKFENFLINHYENYSNQKN